MRVSASVFPKVIKPLAGKLCVAHRVLNVLVTEIMLDRARVVTLVGQLVTGGMTKHVGTHREFEASLSARARDHLAYGRVRQWTATFTDKDI